MMYMYDGIQHLGYIPFLMYGWGRQAGFGVTGFLYPWAQALKETFLTMHI